MRIRSKYCVLLSINLIASYGTVTSVFARSSDATRCVHNLRTIELAKKILAAERQLTNGAAIDPEVIRTEGGPSGTCPSGGTYYYGGIGELPTCSIPNHTREEADKQIQSWKREKDLNSAIGLGVAGMAITVLAAALYFLMWRLRRSPKDV